MVARYELLLRDGLLEQRLDRTFMAEIHPGTTIRIEENDWVVVRVDKRAHAVPEALAVPASKR